MIIYHIKTTWNSQWRMKKEFRELRILKRENPIVWINRVNAKQDRVKLVSPHDYKTPDE